MEYGSDRRQDEVRRKAESDADRLKRDAADLKQEGAQAARQQAESGKQRAAQELDSLSEAVDKAASALSEEDKEGLASYVHQASEQMSQLSRRLNERSLDELTNDVKRLARRNPTAFLLGSVALGFGLSRFLKAAPPETRHDERDWASQQSAAGSYPGASAGNSGIGSPGIAGSGRSQPSPGASTYRSPGSPGATPGNSSDIHH